jgi:hypothetical protein
MGSATPPVQPENLWIAGRKGFRPIEELNNGINLEWNSDIPYVTVKIAYEYEY